MVSEDLDRAELRRTVDWSAAIWAGLFAGLVAFVLYLYWVPVAVGSGNAWAVMRLIASIALGESVLPPPATFDAAVLAVALAVHLALSVFMAVVIAFVLHRWGLLTGIFGGALFGLVFFAINTQTLTLLAPQLYAMSHWSVALVHAVFGALAGGLYEWFEVEPYEREAAA